MPILNNISNLYLGATEATKAYLGDTQVYPVAGNLWDSVPMWEDFEIGNRINNLHAGALGTRVDTDPFAGSWSLTYSGGWAHASDASISYSASPTFEAWVVLQIPSTGTSTAGICIGKQAGSNANGYQILIDTRNGTNASASLQIRRSQAAMLGTISGLGVTVGTWYRLRVRWRDTGTDRIFADLYDVSGNLLGSCTSNNTVYTSGFFGTSVFGNVNWDNFRLQA